MAYSAVTQPRPELRSHPGTPFSIVALHSTRVCSTEISTEPSAVRTNPGVSVSGRSRFGARPSLRKKVVAADLPGSTAEVLVIEKLYGNRSGDPGCPVSRNGKLPKLLPQDGNIQTSPVNPARYSGARLDWLPDSGRIDPLR